MALVAAIVLALLLARFGGPRVRRGVTVVVCSAGTVAVAYSIAAGVAARSSAAAADELDRAAAALRAGDVAAAGEHVTAAASALDRATALVDNPLGLALEKAPVLGTNAEALRRVTAAASAVAARLEPVVASAALLDDAADRVDPGAVDRLAALLDEVADAVEHARGEVAAVRAQPVVPPVAARLDDAAARLAGAADDLQIATDVAEALPALLGAERPHRWLVLFVTPVEARGRSGFPGNYGEIVLDDGRLRLERFGRMTELEAAGAAAGAALDPSSGLAVRWGDFDVERVWRNLTMSPDFPSVAAGFADLYRDATGTAVDGVVSFDPTALAGLAALTGDTRQDLVRFLHVDQYVRFPDVAERVDVLEELARSTLDRLATDLPATRPLVEALARATPGGHVQVWSADPDVESLLVELGAAGELPPVDGDALAVVTNNAGGNKVDLFLHRRVEHLVTWDVATGRLDVTIRITLRNEAPAAGLPDYVIGSALPAGTIPKGTNRTYLSVYTPWDVEGAALDGAAMTVEPHHELGRVSYSLLVDVPPGGTRVLELHLEGALPVGRPYRLDVAAQPLVHPDGIDVRVSTVDGRTVVDRTFVGDRDHAIG